MNIAKRVQPFLWILKMHIQALFDMSRAVTKIHDENPCVSICVTVKTLVMGLILQFLTHNDRTGKRSPGCNRLWKLELV